MQSIYTSLDLTLVGGKKNNPAASSLVFLKLCEENIYSPNQKKETSPRSRHPRRSQRPYSEFPDPVSQTGQRYSLGGETTWEASKHH